MPVTSLRGRIHELVEVTADERGGRRYDGFDVSLAVLIVLNVSAAMLETVDSVSIGAGRACAASEVFSVTVFVIEYVLRLGSCTVDPRYSHPLRRVVRCPCCSRRLSLDVRGKLRAFGDRTRAAEHGTAE